MATCYVRVEGVNLANFIFDVRDLSAIRGGSFLLLDAITRVEKKCSLQPVSTGASSGLFKCDHADPAALRRSIYDVLRSDRELRHATFVVDVVASDDFETARESLVAMNHWRQYQQPSLAVPARTDTTTECAYDHLRPAVGRMDEKPVSLSVKRRRQFGRDRKQDFYAGEMKALAEAIPVLPAEAREARELETRVRKARFANDLETLTKNRDRGSLDAKMAVVYFDGNGFGTIQKSCDETALPEFDQDVKRYRRKVLKRLLLDIEGDSGWRTPAGEYRIETLLWGGDEVRWVVPAWMGWRLLTLFYDESRAWNFRSRDLSHAGGIVFCHHTASIHRMNALAEKLANACKSTFNKNAHPDDHATRDLFAYQVLESFDSTGPNLQAFRESRLPAGASLDGLNIHGAGLGTFTEQFQRIRGFPRSKLHQIVAGLRDASNGETLKPVLQLIDKTVNDLPLDARNALHSLFGFLAPESVTEGDDKWTRWPLPWFHILELWDFVI